MTWLRHPLLPLKRALLTTLLATSVLASLAIGANAQTVPNPPSNATASPFIPYGLIWNPGQWAWAFEHKLDTTNGIMTHNSLGTTFSATGNGGSLAGTCGTGVAAWQCFTGFVNTTTSNASPRFIDWELSDAVQSSAGIVTGVNIEQDVAPNSASTATAGRVALNVFLNDLGSAVGGSHVFSGQEGAVRFSSWAHSNNGASYGSHQGAMTSENLTVDIFPSATNLTGVVAGEIDMEAQEAPSFTGSISGTILTTSGAITAGPIIVGMSIPETNAGVTPGTFIVNNVDATHWTVNISQTVASETIQLSSNFLHNIMTLHVLQSQDAQEGWLGPAIADEYVMQAGADIGFHTLFAIGDDTAAFPLEPYGGVITVAPSYNRSLYPTVTGHLIDTSFMIYHDAEYRGPYHATWTLTSGVPSGSIYTLTSDGLIPNGFVRDAYINNNGSGGGGYTSEPSWTTTGCATAAVIHSGGLAGVGVSSVGVYNPGSGCAAGTSASPASGAATANVLVGGNTLNMPLNSTNVFHCVISLHDTGPGDIGFISDFIGKVGNTPATTTLIPTTPTWTAIGTDSAEAMSATPNTTLGSVNLLLTSTGVTPTVGGSCTMVSNVQTF